MSLTVSSGWFLFSPEKAVNLAKEEDFFGASLLSVGKRILAAV